VAVRPECFRRNRIEGNEHPIKDMNNFWVYILQCNDGSYYAGHTDNLEKRINEHSKGLHNGYTATRLPMVVVFVQSFSSRVEALSSERRIKSWSKKKKEALIKSDWNKISEYARKIFKKNNQ